MVTSPPRISDDECVSNAARLRGRLSGLKDGFSRHVQSGAWAAALGLARHAQNAHVTWIDV